MHVVSKLKVVLGSGPKSITSVYICVCTILNTAAGKSWPQNRELHLPFCDCELYVKCKYALVTNPGYFREDLNIGLNTNESKNVIHDVSPTKLLSYCKAVV